MRAPVLASGQFLSVGATLGVAVAPDDAIDGEQLVRRADIALYRAKAESRGGFRMFDVNYEELLHKRSAIERDLSRALANQELAVQFQPLMAADGERIIGVEALERWNHPDRGMVPPSEFIPIAEHTGLVVGLDEWVLHRACEEAQKWPGLSLSVNLSPSNFRQGNVAERLTRVLVETGFDPRRLEIEITESMLLGATERCSASSPNCGAWASGSRSTTSAPATARSATCGASRSTSSRSTNRSCRTSALPRTPRRSWNA
jgi:predicted signal transduction protein with EAL and GGDEF domain